MQEIKVKPGYKMTELGVIPEDWDVKEIGEVLNYEQPGPYIVNSTEYSDSYKTPVLTANKSFLLGYTNENEGLYTKTPVIIFDDFTLLNKYVEFPFKVKSSAIKFLSLNNRIDNLRFIYEKLQLVKFTIGDHKRYYIGEYQHQKISLPKPEEQKLIAQVLSDTDNLVNSLNELIEKKEKIKEGAMQELLTGKVRLPGFNGDWKELKVGDVISRLSTGLNPRQNFKLGEGDNYYVTIKNIKGTNLLLDNSCDKVSDEAIKIINNRSDLKIGDLLFSSIGNTPNTYLIKSIPKNWNINESVFTIRPNQNIIISKLFQYMVTTDWFYGKLSGTATGSTFQSIKVKSIKDSDIYIPIDINEQKAITDVLSDMDNEIEVLKTKRDKYIKIKEGMMQELLTGKIRLV